MAHNLVLSYGLDRKMDVLVSLPNSPLCATRMLMGVNGG
jgi:hypothetical protein